MIVQTSGEEDGITRVFRWLWHWKYTICIPMMLCGLAAIAVYSNVPPQYSSQAVLVIDVRQRQLMPGESVISSLPQENPVVKTELDIISSRNTAAHVLELLRQRGIPLVPPAEKVHPARLFVRSVSELVASATDAAESIQNAPPSAPLVVAPSAAPADLAPPATTAPSAAPPSAQARRGTEAAIDDLLAGLRVSNDGRSYTIFIEYVSPDRNFAAAAANAFADAYLEKQVEIYDSAAARARDFLGPRVESLRAQLEATELKRQARRQEAGLTADGDASLLTQRLTDLGQELAKVRSAIAEARARLETAQKGTPDAGSSIESPQLQALLSEKSKLERARANYVENGAVRGQALVSVNLQLDGVNREIAEEYQRSLGRLQQEIVVQERKKAIIDADIERMRQALDRNASAQIEIVQLDREVEASSAIYESFLARYKETIEQQGIAVPDARLISAAEPGARDGAGRMVKWLLASLVMGAAVGGVAALGRGALESRKASPDAVAAETGAAVIGFIPRVSRGRLRRYSRALPDPRSDWSAAFTLLQMNALRQKAPGACTVIAVTSVRRGDGKTTVAIGLAQSAVAAGLNPLLVDCDIRQPQIARLLAIGRRPANAAADPESLRHLEHMELHRTPWNSDVLSLAAGGRPESFAVQYRRLATLMREARKAYDLVILDCPALDDHPEAEHLAELADRAVHVVRWPRSRMAEVRAAVRRLGGIVAERRVGVAFVRFDPGAHRFPMIQGPMARPVGA
ncbi:GumC family protein [Oceaniglobus roseus]|uniref:GumC family protein n=1 Tax=Oceaniglobus roseus TaxID=1737570 RepID=UPI000C7F170E|nr:exopolysaccharide transport family protein [Kandeliimicrobium roseum]